MCQIKAFFLTDFFYSSGNTIKRPDILFSACLSLLTNLHIAKISSRKFQLTGYGVYRQPVTL
jgi:hypothetical protein